MDEDARNRLISRLQAAVQELQKTKAEADVMYRMVHAEDEIQSLLLTISICVGDEEIKALLEQVHVIWRKAIIGNDEQAEEKLKRSRGEATLMICQVCHATFTHEDAYQIHVGSGAPASHSCHSPEEMRAKGLAQDAEGVWRISSESLVPGEDSDEGG